MSRRGRLVSIRSEVFFGKIKCNAASFSSTTLDARIQDGKIVLWSWVGCDIRYIKLVEHCNS